MSGTYGVLWETDGYTDFVTPKPKFTTVYTTDGTVKDYVYNTETETFVQVSPGAGEYDAVEVKYYVYDEGEKYESYVDTANAFFIDDRIQTSNIEASVQSMVSMQNLNISFASDTNYNFIEAERTLNQDEKSLTGTFTEDEPMYVGSRQVETHKFKTHQRLSESIKFRIKTTDELEDDVSIQNVRILHNGLILDGDL